MWCSRSNLISFSFNNNNNNKKPWCFFLFVCLFVPFFNLCSKHAFSGILGFLNLSLSSSSCHVINWPPWQLNSNYRFCFSTSLLHFLPPCSLSALCFVIFCFVWFLALIEFPLRLPSVHSEVHWLKSKNFNPFPCITWQPGSDSSSV